MTVVNFQVVGRYGLVKIVVIVFGDRQDYIISSLAITHKCSNQVRDLASCIPGASREGVRIGLMLRFVWSRTISKLLGLIIAE